MNDVRLIQCFFVPAGLIAFWSGSHALLERTTESLARTPDYTWLFDTSGVEVSLSVRPEASQVEWPALFGETQQPPITFNVLLPEANPEEIVLDRIRDYRLTGVIISEAGSIAIIAHNSDVFVIGEGGRLSSELVLLSINWGAVLISDGEDLFNLPMFESETSAMIPQLAFSASDYPAEASAQTVDIAILREQSVDRIGEEPETDVLIYMGSETGQSNIIFQWLDDPGFIE